ncbi:MAG: glycosyltransferase family 9 protein [Candidatus Margulisiibacteriota bacterium]
MYKKILIARCDAIGDVVLALPVIDNLKNAYPDAEIYFLCAERAKDVVINYPGIKEVIIDDISSGKIHTFKDLLAYAKKMEEYHFDLYVSLWKERIYTFLGYLAKIPKRLGPNDKYFSGKLYNLGSPLHENALTKHMYELNLDLLKPLKINIDYTHPDLKIKTKTDPDLIAIAVGARGANKLWPPHNFIPVIKWLNERGKKVFLIGGKEEEAVGEQIAAKFSSSQVINKVGKLKLSETIEGLSYCSLFIGADSGPMHIAAALGLPVVAFFFTKNQKPTRWGPLTRNIVLHNKYYCPKVCRSSECSDKVCVEAVTPEETIEAIKKVLDGGGYKEPQEIFAHWCQKTFNILFIDKGWGRNNLPGLLKSYDFNVHIKPAESNIRFLKDYIICNNINIIHVLSNSIGIKERVLQIYASNFVPSYPLLIENPKKDLNDLDSTLNYYRERFKKL